MKRFLLFLAILTAIAPACTKKPAKLVFEPLPMQYADSIRSAVPYSKDPTVIRLEDGYYMYYSIPAYDPDRLPDTYDGPRDGWHSGIARSQDMIRWENLGEMDLRDTQGNRIWECVAPCVKIFDGQIHLFYQRRPKPDVLHGIWHAVSEDGIRFVNTCDEPVFTPHTDWSIPRAIDAEVYRLGEKMILIYATRDPQGEVQMLGMAEAPYGSDYGPDQWTLLTRDGALLQPEFEWEGHCIEAATVIKENGLWYMFYAGSYNHERQQIGVAWSRDGRFFKRLPPDGLVFPHGEEGSWNEWESGHPGVFRDRDGQVYLFYQGKANLKGNYWLSVAKVTFE